MAVVTLLNLQCKNGLYCFTWLGSHSTNTYNGIIKQAKQHSHIKILLLGYKTDVILF